MSKILTKNPQGHKPGFICLWFGLLMAIRGLRLQLSPPVLESPDIWPRQIPDRHLQRVEWRSSSHSCPQHEELHDPLGISSQVKSDPDFLRNERQDVLKFLIDSQQERPPRRRREDLLFLSMSP